MFNDSRLLSQSGIERAIALFRRGESVALICHRGFDAFSPATIYPIQKIVGGNALELIDDDNELITLAEDYPGLGCFLVTDNPQEAEAIASRMKKAFLGGLASRVRRLLTKNEFKPGQVVQWKAGMAVSTMPALNQPAVVIEILDTPVTDPNGHLLDPMRTLRCDMVIAFDSSTDDILITTLADSRRFELYPHQDDSLLAENAG